MPSGRTHDRITFWSFPAVVSLSYLFTRQGHLTAIAAGAFLFSGLMFGPDLDIHSVQYKRWGKLRWIWRPYQQALSHRSQLSHGFIIGTAIRLFYLACIATVLAIPASAAARLIGGLDWSWEQLVQQTLPAAIETYPQEGMALLVGLEVGAMSHSLSDWLASAYKRRRRKRTKGSKRRPRW